MLYIGALNFPQPPTTSQGGALVAVVRGALGPQLEKTIKEQLEYEHQVLEGKAERKQVGGHWKECALQTS